MWTSDQLGCGAQGQLEQSRTSALSVIGGLRSGMSRIMLRTMAFAIERRQSWVTNLQSRSNAT